MLTCIGPCSTVASSILTGSGENNIHAATATISRVMNAPITRRNRRMRCACAAWFGDGGPDPCTASCSAVEKMLELSIAEYLFARLEHFNQIQPLRRAPGGGAGGRRGGRRRAGRRHE